MSNDPLLDPVLRASGEDGREREIEQVLTAVVEPLARRIVGRYTSAAAAMAREDAEDIVATIVLSLLRRLRTLSVEGDEIRDFSAYIAMLTYNAINDQLRRRYPNRTRLKNHVRYVVLGDERLWLRSAPGGLAVGLGAWNESDAVARIDLSRASATRSMLRHDRPGDAIVEILRSAGKPLLFDALVETLAELWEITDLPPLALASAEQVADDTLRQFEKRDVLRALWREIQALPLPQRKALLLNLRDRESVNVISVLTLSGIATFDEIAAAMEMMPEELGGLWNRLPLDDLTIAGMLGLTRQQVINLRKSARERLARRVFAPSR